MTDGKSLSVVMLPDSADSNPYQARLRAELEELDVTVHMAPIRGVVPLTRGWLAADRPAVVHLHWVDKFVNTERSSVAALLAASLLVELTLLRFLGTTVVWTVHNVASHERRHPHIERVLRRGVASLSDRLVVHCESARDRVRRVYGLPEGIAERIRVVPHGNYVGWYPDDVGTDEARRKLGLPTDDDVLLYFGLIREYKNVPELIRTFGGLGTDARLLVVGNPWTEALAGRVRAAADEYERVETVLEYVPDEEVQLYFNAADAAVFPFESVLTSGSTLLAMSFGRAVVVPDVGCPGELVDERGGVTYDPTDDDGLAGALREILGDDADCAAMGRHNRRIADRLEWDRIAARTRELYALEDRPDGSQAGTRVVPPTGNP